VLGDIMGELTSVNYNGSSVVDYVATSQDLRSLVKTFKVLSLTKYSDHKPCVTELAVRHHLTAAEDILGTLQDAPGRYKWPNDDNIDHKFMLTMNSPSFRDKIHALGNVGCRSKEEVLQLNTDIVQLYREVADNVIPKTTRPHNRKKGRRGKRMKPKSPWFDSACIMSKRNLNLLAKKYGNSPQNENFRNAYYEGRRGYRRLIKRKREEFFEKLCKDIEEGNNVNWKTFKSLKKSQSPASCLDAFDMVNFCNFFKDLCGKLTIQEDKIATLKAQMTKDEIREELTGILDSEISMDELTVCVKKSKKGKAVAEDLVPNEFLKASTKGMLSIVLNLFSQCLSLGVYPWTTSVVTPLHKKGSIYDPNNYRAIAPKHPTIFSP
jgi:hypothetical protein